MRAFLNADGLRRELALRGLTQAEIAAIAGLTEATVSHAMNGRRVEHRTIRALARALTVTPALPGAAGIVGAQNGSAATAVQATAAPGDGRHRQDAQLTAL